MDSVVLTERQQAERAFYQEHARLHAPESVSFDPVAGHERRPWNPYWFVYEQARVQFEAGARRVLDFGCGKGVVSVRFAHIGYEVCGFDISPNNIEVARRLAERYGFAERTSFSVQLAEHLEYEDASFDLVVGMDILHHIDIPPAIEQVYRVLKPGGKAIFREHVEVPVQERLRNCAVGRWLVPPGESLERNTTRYERKMNRNDLSIIARRFPRMQIHRFTLLSRLNVFLERRWPRWPSRIERWDRHLFQAVPGLDRLGATAVIVAEKPSAV